MEPTTAKIGTDTIRIYDRVVADSHLADVRALVLGQRASQRQSVASLSIGGWKSQIRIFDELACTQAGHALVEAIRPVLANLSRRPIVSSWAMVNERGARHPWHTHKAARITGVIFICADSDASPLELAGPRPDIGQIAERVSVPAIAGRLVIFPGHVWHQVPEVTGDGVRISIAFDVH